MALPRFSEMLVDRRESLGLTVSQAARVLRIKEITLVAFETGDFDNMPPSGYAQGMLASYARYLGLNPTLVTDQYNEDLFVHENGSSSYELRRRTRQTRESEPSEIPSYDRPDNSARGRAESRRISDDPVAGLDTAPMEARRGRGLVTGTHGRYSTQHAEQDPASGLQARFGGRTAKSTPLVTGRPYTSAASAARPRSASTGYSYRSSSSYGRSAGAPTGAAANARRSMAPGDIAMQPVYAGEYVDDLRYDGIASGFTPASSSQGRAGARNIASRERPRVRRRQSEPSSQGKRRRRGRSRGNQGLLGSIAGNPLVLMVAGGVVVLVIVLVVVFGLRSCGSKGDGAEGQKVPVTTVVQEQSSSSPSTSSSSANASQTTSSSSSSSASSATAPTTGSGSQAQSTTDANANASSPATTTPSTPTTGGSKVVVEVLDGKVSWVEVSCDGQSVLANTVTGPKTYEYEVHESFSISVAEPTGVSVTRDGQKLTFDSKVQGMGQLSFQLAQPKTSGNTSSGSAQDAAQGSGDSSD